MRIITSGSSYVDIDAYAGVIAYAELLEIQGQAAKAVITSVWNESISKTVRSWHTPLLTSYKKNNDDTYTLIDVSDPQNFAEFVVADKVNEVIDHHPGHEQYWQERLGSKAHIEYIGAACTLVYERWEAAGKIREMSEVSAKLLVSGMLDNTLNFKAHVTSKRDLAAYQALVEYANITPDWTALYFSECQQSILENATVSIRNDSKILSFKTFPRPMSVGQLVVWDAAEVLSQHRSTIEQELTRMKHPWFMNVVSVEEGKSYFVCHDTKVRAWISGLLGVSFIGDVATASRLWLRKEIMKQDLDNGAAFSRL